MHSCSSIRNNGYCRCLFNVSMLQLVCQEFILNFILSVTFFLLYVCLYLAMEMLCRRGVIVNNGNRESGRDV